MFIGISTITRGQTPAKSSLWSHEIYQTRCRRNRCQGAQHLGLGTRSWDLGKASTQFLWQFLDDKKKLPYLFHGVKKTINEWQIYSTHIWKRKFCKYDDKNEGDSEGDLDGRIWRQPQMWPWIKTLGKPPPSENPTKIKMWSKSQPGYSPAI